MRKMRVKAAVLAAVFLCAALVRADEGERLLLLLPIFGAVPPELQLPHAEQIAESLLLELPEGIRVVAEEPAGRLPAGDIQGLVKARAVEREAKAVVWGELMSPGACQAARLVRIRILDVGSGLILDRDICPEQAGTEALSRAIAVATMNALRSGLVQSLTLIDDHAAPADKVADSIPQAPTCPECPEPKPCSEATCPPPPPCPEPGRGRFTLAAGATYTSHPSWRSYGLGAALEFSYAALGWLELGAGLQTIQGRQITVTNVDALYTSWPMSVFARALVGGGRLAATGELGLSVSASRLEALLAQFNQTRTVERINPAAFARLGIRWWFGYSVGFQLSAGPTVYLRRQRYTYSYNGEIVTVISMQAVSLEAAVLLVVGF